MSQDEGEAKRTIWAQGAAESIIDDVLAAKYSAEDQAALLRELARRALLHLPNSGDEARILARDLLWKHFVRRIRSTTNRRAVKRLMSALGEQPHGPRDHCPKPTKPGAIVRRPTKASPH